MPEPAPGFAKRPDHTVALEPCPDEMRATLGDTVVARSSRAIVLREATYPPVIYFPPDALTPGLFQKTEHTTYCPFKGHASYWTVGASPEGENVAWGYEDPYLECESIRGYVAFYADRVDVKPTAAEIEGS